MSLQENIIFPEYCCKIIIIFFFQQVFEDPKYLWDFKVASLSFAMEMQRIDSKYETHDFHDNQIIVLIIKFLHVQGVHEQITVVFW